MNGRQELKDKKAAVKELTEDCNACKREIDAVKAKLDEKAEEKKKQMREDLAVDDDEPGTGQDGG